jgi:hypothetical protein
MVAVKRHLGKNVRSLEAIKKREKQHY